MRSWPATRDFHVGFAVDGQFYVRQREVGLMRIVNDSLVMAPLGAQFADERISAILPFPGGRNPLLLATRTNGLLLYDGVSLRRFVSEADSILTQGQIYCAALLPGGRYAFGTLQEGVKSLYFEAGLWRDEGRIEGIDQEIRSIYETAEGRLWLTALNNGLLRVDPAAGFTRRPTVERFDTLHGLPGNACSVAFASSPGLRFATERGVFRFEEAQRRFFPDPSLIRGLPPGRNELFTVQEDRQGNLWMVATEKARSGVALRQPDGSYRWQENPFLRIAGIDA